MAQAPAGQALATIEQQREDFVNALLAGTADFELLVSQLLTNDNDARGQAEAVFVQLKKHADACVTLLVKSLRSSPNAEHKSLSAVMIRRVTKLFPSAYDMHACMHSLVQQGPGLS